MIRERIDGGECAVNEIPENSGGDFSGGFIDGHDAAGVESGLVVGFVSGKNFELRMHDQQVAGVAIEFDFAEKSHAQSGSEAVGKIAAMEPLGHQALMRGVGEDGFEQAEILAAESGQARRLYFRDDGCHFAWSELRNGLNVGAIFVAEWRVAEQVFDSTQTFGFEHFRARGSDALQEFQWSGSVQRKVPK